MTFVILHKRRPRTLLTFARFKRLLSSSYGACIVLALVPGEFHDICQYLLLNNTLNGVHSHLKDIHARTV